MITYNKEPLSPPESSRIKAWLASAESSLFRDCVNAQLNEHYFDAINIQSKEAGSQADELKFTNMAQAVLADARDVATFIRIFEKFSDPEYGFHRVKVNT